MRNTVYKKIFAVPILSAVALSAISQPSHFIDSSYMDLRVAPGDDFYQYASGTWVQNNPVPDRETRWGSFNVLRDFNINAVKSILEKAAADPTAPAGSVTRRVGDFYISGMDSAAIEKLGIDPIKPYLQRIAAIKELRGVITEISELRKKGLAAPLYGFHVGQDRKDVARMVPQFTQGGIGLSDRDYYLKDDPRSRNIRAAYKNYLATLFRLSGTAETAAAQRAQKVISLETELARAQKSRVEMRDAEATYHKFSLIDLNKITPGLDWSQILIALHVPWKDSVLVNNPGFFTAAAALLQQRPVEDWKDYLQAHLLRRAAPYLSASFVDAEFAYTQVVTGQKTQRPRWQRMASLTDAQIGELLGQLYVKEYFKPEAKARMIQLVDNLRQAFARRIKGLDWMSETTKQKALAKLAAFRPKIAYPDQWKQYQGLDISRHRFFENVRAAHSWQYRDMVDRLGKPVDRERWGMTPPTVNAYYSATLNEIVFPAGILQFPFFDPNADDAVNYGGIGAVIGHEMSHGFDDNGSKYDADGTLRNWWTPQDRQQFEARAARLVAQYNDYTVLDTLHVNGKLTLGENIGDLGGLNVAYEAFRMTPQGKSDQKIDGFTPDQRFFLSWAQVWRGNILPQAAAQRIITDTHSPGPYRTIGPIVNMDSWYEAFGVKEGDKLYKKPEARIRIW